MDFLILIGMLVVAMLVLKKTEQARRIALLREHLARFDIEKLMEGLTEGYLRALGEVHAERQAQVWEFLGAKEFTLRTQFQGFADAFGREEAAPTRVSTLPLALPFATQLLPALTFDLRQALAIHAQGIADAVDNHAQRSPKARAYTLSAELFLMQHTCHWFCRSKTVASARLLARHQTPYAQVLASVAPATRARYEALLQGRGA